MDLDKVLELVHKSNCGFSYCTEPARYTFEQKELVKLFNNIFSILKEEIVEEILYKIEEGLCDKCEYRSEYCEEECSIEGWDWETFIKWLNEYKND